MHNSKPRNGRLVLLRTYTSQQADISAGMGGLLVQQVGRLGIPRDQTRANYTNWWGTPEHSVFRHYSAFQLWWPHCNPPRCSRTSPEARRPRGMGCTSLQPHRREMRGRYSSNLVESCWTGLSSSHTSPSNIQISRMREPEYDVATV